MDSTEKNNCMHGGTRDKKSKFWSYNPRQPHVNFLAWLGLMCDQSHQHESWKPRWVDGKLFFPTAAEAAYPPTLCQSLASLCLDEANSSNLAPCTELHDLLVLDGGIGKRNLFASQSRGNKLKQILREYGCKIKAAAPLVFQQLDNFLANFPKGTKIIHRQVQAGYLRDEWNDQMSYAVKDHISKSSRLVCLEDRKHS